ncbi:MAG: nickel pincer cofactor biosynthesis protein LarB, partial [Elusimicrobiota bacterium]
KRYSRQGFPEAIYCPGKTVDQIISIARRLQQHGGPVIGTRADEKIFRAIKRKFKSAKYFASARIILVSKQKNAVRNNPAGYVCVVTAGTTDIPVAEEASVIAEILGSKVERVYDIGVAGAHRLFEHSDKLQKAACVVVCAGMEGALPSIIGGLVGCPVVGVPTSVGYGSNLKGFSALLTMLNSCAVNVCAVNIDDGIGAGVIAHLINGRPFK